MHTCLCGRLNMLLVSIGSWILWMTREPHRVPCVWLVRSFSILVQPMFLFLLINGRCHALDVCLGLGSLLSPCSIFLFSLHLVQLLFDDSWSIEELLSQVVPPDVTFLLETVYVVGGDHICGEWRQLVQNISNFFWANWSCIFST